MSTIAENIAKVGVRIREAAQACARDLTTIGLLAVSKTKPASAIRQAFNAGLHDFGENYLQEALEKQIELADLPLTWHFIGPIQSNKTKPIAEHFDWAHSVDRLKTAQRLSAQRPNNLPALNICLQVNINDEASKAGCSVAELPALATAVAALPGIKLRGLMAIPAPSSDPLQQNADFAHLCELQEALKQTLKLDLDTLSMGMSDDLEAAIAQGSTWIRIGSAVFGARDYSQPTAAIGSICTPTKETPL
jgi:pyridoxal phosphate enzyme (YggS family)